MALGGGMFTVQNKILPGAYLNFVSTAHASSVLSERGVATLPLEMDWGPEGKIFTVEMADFRKDSLNLFGYAYGAAELAPLREIFQHAKTVHVFRLNTEGEYASNDFATARYPGKRGNDLKILIQPNEASTDDAPSYDVSTYLGTTQVDLQKGILTTSDLKDNDFVTWKPDAVLALTASTPLTGGVNGKAEDSVYQAYLDQADGYSFHTMGCPSTSDAVKKLFADYCKRMRDETGKKFQCVVFNYPADYEGIVSVKNGLAEDKNSAALIPWVTGAIAGTAVNRSATNMVYDGEYSIDTSYTQTQLESGIQEGSFMFHMVDGQAAVLEDVNTFISATDEKSADFSSNQTVRVLDQIANDIALLFARKYLGKVPNNRAGQLSLWSDIVAQHKQLQTIQAIEDFQGEHVSVDWGTTKKSVAVTDRVTPVNAMTQLYMSVYVQ